MNLWKEWNFLEKISHQYSFLDFSYLPIFESCFSWCLANWLVHAFTFFPLLGDLVRPIWYLFTVEPVSFQTSVAMTWWVEYSMLELCVSLQCDQILKDMPHVYFTRCVLSVSETNSKRVLEQLVQCNPFLSMDHKFWVVSKLSDSSL